MSKKLKNSIFFFGLIATLVICISSCKQPTETQIEKTIIWESKVVLGPEKPVTKLGKNTTLTVLCSAFEATPQNVNVYLENDDEEETIYKDIEIKNNTIEIPTNTLKSGRYQVYVQANSIKSNVIKLKISDGTTNEQDADLSDATIFIEGPSKISKGYSCSIKMTFTDWEGYSFTKPPYIYLYVDGIETNSNTISSNSFGIYSDSLVNFEGKHKVYLYCKDENIKSNEIEIEVVNGLVDPDITVTKSDIKNCAKISWFNTGASYYHLYHATQNSISTATHIDTYSSGYNYSFSSSDAEGKHYFWVVASNSYNEPDKSTITAKSVAYDFQREEFSNPTGLSVTPVEGNSNYVNLKWKDNQSKYYAIYYSTSATCPSYPKNYNISYTKNGYDILLSTSGKYYFWVKSYTDSYSSETNLSAPVSYSFTYTNPKPVTNLTATAYNSPKNSVKLQWTKSNSRSYYILFNCKDDYDNAVSLGSTEYNYKTKMLPTTGTYYFWVIASDTGSYTEADATKISYNLATFDDDGISAPENVTVTPSSSTSSYVTVSCDTVSIEDYTTYYWIYYSKTNDPASATLYTTTSTLPYQFSRNTFSKGQTYYFWVKAGNYSWDYSSLQISDVSETVSCIPYPNN